jgi:hypothetical protein
MKSTKYIDVKYYFVREITIPNDIGTRKISIVDSLMMTSFMFGSVVAVAFQSVFHSKTYQNNVFFCFFKIIFDINK